MMITRENAAHDDDSKQEDPSTRSNNRKRKYYRHSPHNIQNLLTYVIDTLYQFDLILSFI